MQIFTAQLLSGSAKWRQEESIDGKWNTFKCVVKFTAEETVGYRHSNRKKKP